MSPICRNPFSLFLLALFCMLLATPIRASTQHHHHNHQNHHSGTTSENGAESSNQIENNNLAIEADEQLTTQGNAPAENGNGNDELLNSPMEEANRGIGSGKALFREYLDRGMLTCSTKYFGILRKLNKLISVSLPPLCVPI